MADEIDFLFNTLGIEGETFGNIETSIEGQRDNATSIGIIRPVFKIVVDVKVPTWLTPSTSNHVETAKTTTK